MVKHGLRTHSTGQIANERVDTYVHLNPVDGTVELALQVADVEATCVVGSQVIGHVLAEWQRHYLDVGDAHDARDDL